MRLAYLCRYGHFNLFELLGRDPYEEPLTEEELFLIQDCLQEHVEAEFKIKQASVPGL